MKWVDYIIQAMQNLGGWATYSDLYKEIKKVRNEDYTPAWQATVRNVVESHSSDSENWREGKPDHFYSVNGIGSGAWGLRAFGVSTQKPADISDLAPPNRVPQEIYRILRDTALARAIKVTHNYECQICGESIQLSDGSYYAEAHHVKPLGSPHNGPDIAENIICLCPNHHVQVDYGVIDISKLQLKKHGRHRVSETYTSYHNKVIYNKL
jgi:5-methylcytosine-specific restriction endonuclease McrA